MLGTVVKLMLLLPSVVQAQTIIAPSGRTLFHGASLVRTTFEMSRSSFNSIGESATATKYVPVVAVVYGFLPRWSLIVAQPYAGVQTVHRMSDRTERQGFSGLGDTRLFVQYDGLYSRNSPGGLTRLSGVFGLQLPSGSSRLTMGAVQYSAGLIFERATRLNYVFSADSEYTFATANGRGMSAGNGLRFDGAVARFVIPKKKPGADSPRRTLSSIFRYGAYFILELNGQWQGSSTLHGASLANTGGTTLLLSPGIQYFVSNSLLTELSVPIPVLRDLRGAQLRPQTSFVMGFRYLFWKHRGRWMMRRLGWLLLLPLLALALAGPAWAQVERATVKINGMIWGLWARGAQKALQRLDGVDHAEVSLVKGEGIVFAKQGKSFDPAQIPKAIQGAGFTATEVTVAVVGEVEQTNSGLRLHVPGLSRPFLLVGGGKMDILAKQKITAGKNFLVTGKLQNEGQAPALTVDDFQDASLSR